jgi:hypothetical protein
MKKITFMLLALFLLSCSKEQITTPTPRISLGEKIDVRYRFDEASITIESNSSIIFNDGNEGYLINFNISSVREELINVYLIDADTTFLGSFTTNLGVQNIYYRGYKSLTKPYILCKN